MEEITIRETPLVFFTAQNLYTFTNYIGMDPEVGFGVEDNAKRNYSSGIDVGYYPHPRTYLIWHEYYLLKRRHMKKISIYILLTMLIFSACKESFLDSDPITTQTAEGYFQTPKNALEGLTGCYNGLILDEWTNLFMITTVASDEALPEVDKVKLFQEFHTVGMNLKKPAI
jgi:hypothetical protein